MIKYTVGDATKPVDGDSGKKKIIVHICNNVGAWGAGFVLAISNRWKEPEEEYRGIEKYVLGMVQFVQVEDDTVVANMVAQDGIGYSRNRKRRVDYDALRSCLSIVREYCLEVDATIHMPRIGCGLGGGRWNDIERIIKDELDNLNVYVYDLPKTARI